MLLNKRNRKTMNNWALDWTCNMRTKIKLQKVEFDRPGERSPE